MKRPLHVFDGPVTERAPAPRLVCAGNRIVSVADTGDGSAAWHFASALLAAGATPLSPDAKQPRPDHRIVIRAALASAEAWQRSEALEASADVLLGSVRPVFAALFVSACAVGATS